MLGAAVKDIYPPLGVTNWWFAGSILLLVFAIGGYFGVRWLRVRLALRAQVRLTDLQKPRKADIMNRALQEIARIKAAVGQGTVAPDTGAAQISLVVRTAFDALMNHRTIYQSKGEVAQRELTTMVGMLDVAYPTEFGPASPDAARFAALCDQAVKVVYSCN